MINSRMWIFPATSEVPVPASSTQLVAEKNEDNESFQVVLQAAFVQQQDQLAGLLSLQTTPAQVYESATEIERVQQLDRDMAQSPSSVSLLPHSLFSESVQKVLFNSTQSPVPPKTQEAFQAVCPVKEQCHPTIQAEQFPTQQNACDIHRSSIDTSYAFNSSLDLFSGLSPEYRQHSVQAAVLKESPHKPLNTQPIQSVNSTMPLSDKNPAKTRSEQPLTPALAPPPAEDVSLSHFLPVEAPAQSVNTSWEKESAPPALDGLLHNKSENQIYPWQKLLPFLKHSPSLKFASAQQTSAALPLELQDGKRTLAMEMPSALPVSVDIPQTEKMSQAAQETSFPSKTEPSFLSVANPHAMSVHPLKEATPLPRSIVSPSEPPPVAEQLGAKIRLMRLPDRHEFKLSLKPAELGKITLHLTQQEQQVKLHLLTETWVAKDLLESHVLQLKQQLQQQGLHLQQVVVECQPDHTGGQSSHFHDSRQTPEQQRSAFPVWEEESLDEALDLSAILPPHLLSSLETTHVNYLV